MVPRRPYWSGFAARARAALGALGTSAWWKEALEAWWRQWLQAALPWLLLVAATGAVTQDGLLTVVWAAGSGLVTVVLGRISGLRPDPWPGAVQRTYRAASAAAASLLTAWPATATGLVAVDWGAVAAAAVASAVASLVHGVLDPPATTVAAVEPDYPAV